MVADYTLLAFQQAELFIQNHAYDREQRAATIKQVFGSSAKAGFTAGSSAAFLAALAIRDMPYGRVSDAAHSLEEIVEGAYQSVIYIRETFPHMAGTAFLAALCDQLYGRALNRLEENSDKEHLSSAYSAALGGITALLIATGLEISQKTSDWGTYSQEDLDANFLGAMIFMGAMLTDKVIEAYRKGDLSPEVLQAMLKQKSQEFMGGLKGVSTSASLRDKGDGGIISDASASPELQSVTEEATRDIPSAALGD